jgi:hypothetical protein
LNGSLVKQKKTRKNKKIRQENASARTTKKELSTFEIQTIPQKRSNETKRIRKITLNVPSNPDD